ncbi:MAG: SPOR domain-containing protein [Deltaproteobacteria bacterium]|nr:SPOR domain-containing protein [Deltaproteobacteria bacterium]
MHERKNISLQPVLLCFVFIISILLSIPTPVYCAAKYYYYVQVASYRVERNATRYAQKLRLLDINTVVRCVQVADMGYWNRVYTGPFPSKREAKLKGLEFRKKGFFSGPTIVHKKQSLFCNNLKEKPEMIIEKAMPAPEKVLVKAGFLEDTTVLAKEKRIKVSSVEDKIPAEKPPPAQDLIEEKRPAVKENSPAHLTGLGGSADNNRAKKGRGRNVGQGRLVLGIKHTYLDVPTELTKRTSIRSDGVTITKEKVTLGNVKKDDFPTSMHIDTFRLRYGLTDYLEIFADIGFAYDELPDPEFVYGLGARLNLFERTVAGLGKFYGVLQGEYLAGSLEEEYKSRDGYRWKKETDWQMISTGVELGVIRSRFAVYVGGSYLIYSEDTDRVLKDIPPSPLISFKFRDDLEEENRCGVYAGIEFQLSPAFQLNIQGQVLNEKSIFVALEYYY